ncbi:MAG: hypothetical protein ABW352_07160 [Polyangiales bacterium]
MFALGCFGCDAVGSEDADPSQQGLASGEDSGIGILVPVAIPDAGRDPGLNSKVPAKTDAGVPSQGDAGQVEGDASVPSQGDAGQGEQSTIKVRVLDTENTGGLPDCNAVYFRDIDGDGFGDAKAKVTSCTKPAGYVEIDGDCFDYNERAYPNATGQFLQNRGDGSFDYDCDGVETKLHTKVASCPELHCAGLACDAAALQDATELGENGGWTVQANVPACGQQAAWGLSVTWFPGVAKASCAAPNEGSMRTQTCR